MKVIIDPTYAEICKRTANYIMNKINNHTENRPFVLGLPTGSTPLGVYQELIRLNKINQVSFKNVITFNMDEYIGLDKENVNSYYYFMYDNFFNHIDINKKNINLLNGLALDYNKECKDYEKKIKNSGGIDLFLCGIGKDGHIAFNEPGSSLNSRTRVKTLCMETIEDNARFFKKEINAVPKSALTVGIGTIMDAKEIILLASGRNKARAIQNLIEGSISSKYPCTILQNHNKCLILCDDESTEELKMKTYKYYKNLQNLTNIDGKSIINCVDKNILYDDKILITSPHPDDDIIGCGGILQYFPNKANVKILYMTNGTGGIKTNEDRLKEALSAITVLGYTKKNIEYLDLPFYNSDNREIGYQDMRKVLDYINIYNPKHIFVCNDHDPKGTHLKCKKILQSIDIPNFVEKIWLYNGAWQKWKNEANASLKLTSECFDKKILALNMHFSQYPLLINNKENKNLDERCKEVSTDDNGNLIEKFKIINVEDFKN